VCDIEERRAHLAAERFGAPSVFTSAADMLCREPLDVVAVLTPQHEPLIEAALRAGHHVFTEKPISLCLSLSQDLVALARRNGLVLEVGLMRLFDNGLAELLRALPPTTVTSGLFTKVDGSDAVTRRQLLPPGVEAYTFGRSGLPRQPEGLAEEQLDVLKTLLWSGAHLLSACHGGFGPLAALATSSRPGGSSVHCLLEGADGQRLFVAVVEVGVPVFQEEIRVFAARAAGCLRFSSPYIQPSSSELILETADDGTRPSRRDVYSESVFANMWTEFADRLDGAEREGESSADVMLAIESTALQCARLA